MPVDLDQPLRWTRASGDALRMLRDLQANILKGHGRAHSAFLFLRFDASQAGSVRDFLRKLPVSDALSQLQEGADYRRAGIAGATVTLCLLSADGYKAMRVSDRAPADPAFHAGMAARTKILGDPAPGRWERHLCDPCHALVVLADDDAARLGRERIALLTSLPGGVALAGEERGLRMESTLSPGEPIEHFGFVDGRSNPLLLEEDIEREHWRAGTSPWNPGFGLRTVLARDPGGSSDTSFGSFVVFRKLEQDVRAFWQTERSLAQALRLNGADKQRAAALVVGRYRDGTPLALGGRPDPSDPVPNDFGYADDPHGRKCPVQAHIRKVNPRGTVAATGDMTLAQERSHAIVRRGTTYGRRDKHPNSPSLTLADLPSKGVGVLFMAYQGDIANQFEFVQSRWANSPDFFSPRHASGGPITGTDPVIGQGPGGSRVGGKGQSWPATWGGKADAPRKEFNFQGYVRMLGGEYFFAPSISTLKSL